MSKGVLLFIIFIILSLTLESFLLLRMMKPNHRKIVTVPTMPNIESLKNIAPAESKIASISLSKNGFTPSLVKINPGDKVIWTNNTNDSAAINSDPHPSHALYPALNLDVFAPGQTLRLIFVKNGTYSYHNHLNPSQKGTIIVE